MSVARRRLTRRRVRGSWQDFEYAKAEWVHRNPGATAEQYDAAVAAIAKRLCL